MTLDKSLKIKRGSASARAVLTRAERIKRLKDEDKWKDGQSPVGLPKVRVFKLAMKKKKKKEAEGDAGAPAAKGGKTAAGAKPAAAKPAAKK